MEKLIEILKAALPFKKVEDIIQVGSRELNIIVSSHEDVMELKKMAALTHDDSEVKIKGIRINFVDRYGTWFGSL